MPERCLKTDGQDFELNEGVRRVAANSSAQSTDPGSVIPGGGLDEMS